MQMNQQSVNSTGEPFLGFDDNTTTLSMANERKQGMPPEAYKLCRACKARLSEGELTISCSSCTFRYHLDCASVTKRFVDYFVRAKQVPWYCPICYTDIKQHDRENTDAIKQISHTLSNLQLSVAKLQSTNTSWQQNIESELNEKLEQRFEELSNKLETKLNNIDQGIVQEKKPLATNGNSRRRNLIISKIPRLPNENVPELIVKISRALGVVASDLIDNCYRLGKETPAEPTKSDIILLKCRTELQRDQLLQAYYARVKANPPMLSHIGLNVNSRFYINEDMYPDVKKVFDAAMRVKTKAKITTVRGKSNVVSILRGNSWTRVHSVKELEDAIGVPINDK